MRHSPGKYETPRKGRDPLRPMLALLCLSALLFGGMLLCTVRARRQFHRLAGQARQTAAAETAGSTAAPTTAAPTEPPAAEPDETSAPPQILPRYQPLYEQNPDLFGWITIADTPIDYPVMHTPQEPEKYLHADFDAQYSFAGTPFVDAACTGGSDNILIYAHNMLDGSMFRSLLNYREKTWWQKHPVICFNTLYEEQEYEVLAAFYDRVYYKTETCFKFYQFIDAADAADFDTAIRNFREKALYDTGVTAAYGDKLITLVTCAYHTDNGRFVVVARRK